MALRNGGDRGLVGYRICDVSRSHCHTAEIEESITRRIRGRGPTFLLKSNKFASEDVKFSNTSPVKSSGIQTPVLMS